MVEENIIRAYLETLDKKQPGLKLQSFIKFPCRWITLHDDYFEEYVKKYGFPNHRELLRNEILIDVDSEDNASGKAHADLVEAELKRKGIFYKRYLSGGDGEHFHIWINDIQMNQTLSKNSLGEVRKEIIKYYVGDKLLRPDKWDVNPIKSHICLYNKTLVQIEGWHHRKGGIKTLLTNNSGINDLSDRIIYNLDTLYEKKLKNKEEIKKYNINIPKPDCIKFFEGETINGLNWLNVKDGLYRVAFSLMTYYKRRGGKQMETIKKMKAWRDSLPSDWIKSSFWKIDNQKLIYMYKASDCSAGCNYRMAILDDIGCPKVCDECPYSFRYNFDKIKKMDSKISLKKDTTNK